MFKFQPKIKDGLITFDVNDQITKSVTEFYEIEPFPNYSSNEDKRTLLDKGDSNDLSRKLKEFIGWNCSSCLYDNFINHTSEGIAQDGYNIYAPDYLDIQNNDFGDYKILESNSETLNYWETIFENFNSWDAFWKILSDS